MALSFPIALAMSVTSVREEKCERLNVVHFVQWYVFGEPLKRRLFFLFVSFKMKCACVSVLLRERQRQRVDVTASVWKASLNFRKV